MLYINNISLTLRFVRLSFLLEKQTKYSMYNIQLFCPKVISVMNPGSMFILLNYEISLVEIYIYTAEAS